MEKDDLARLDRTSCVNRTVSLAAIGCSGAQPCCTLNCDYNRFKALCGRVFRKSKVERPNDEIYIWLRKFVPLLLPGFAAKAMSVDDWLRSMPSRRRRVLERAAQTYKRTGWLPRYGQFKAFLKTEKLPGFGKDPRSGLVRLTNMLDRLIQGPHDVSHIIAGPVLKPLIKRLKEIWGPDDPIFYGSTTPEKLHKWLQRLVDEKGSYFWCDYSMYDNTHSKQSWEFMEWLYESGGDIGNDFRKVMSAWRRPMGTMGPFKYQADYMNASGRDDTALANGVLNGFAAYLSACAAWLRKDLMSLSLEDVQVCKGLIKISVCGDDSLGSIPLCDPSRLAKFRSDMATNIARFGFEAKLNVSQKLYDAVYLGNRPYPTRKGWFWGKTIGRATYKMGWVIDRGQDILAHVTGIADMHKLCSSHVPILSDLADKIVELRGGAKRTPVTLDPDRPWEWTQQSGVKYDDVTIAAVTDIYSTNRTPGTDLTPYSSSLDRDQVVKLIRQIQAINKLPFVLDSDTWRRLILVDDL